ncbi:hypothetical protein FGG78_09100 [Thioclava sp. BHET1]|nr:hypothetical protein FGG78_09100 [Thioclava sp. BHET1]
MIAQVQPQVILVAAGTPPAMGPLDTMEWTEFENCWQADVRITLTWVLAALTSDLPDGAHLILVSSGSGARLCRQVRAGKSGLAREEFFARFGSHLTPEFFGRAVAEMLEGGSGSDTAFTLTTRAGLQAIPA